MAFGNKNKAIAALLALLSAAGGAAWLARGPAHPGSPPPAIPEIVAERARLAPPWLERSFKLAQMTSAPDNRESLLSAIGALRHYLDGWQQAYPDDTPPLFARSRDWPGDLDAMLALAAKADEWAREGRHDEAARTLAEAWAIYQRIRRENGLDRGETEALAFYQAAGEVSRSTSRFDAEPAIDHLRYELARLKEYDLAPGYQEELDRIENVVKVLSQSLDGPDFRQAQAEIAQLAEALYLDY